jgi:O-antigen/teichoic acid export membrane protein
MNNIIKSSIWRGAQLIVKQGMNIFIFFIVAHLVDPGKVGLYSYVSSIAVLLGLVGDFGISTATSKYVAEYSKTDQTKLKSIVASSFILIATVAATLSLGFIVINTYILHMQVSYVLFIVILTFLIPISYLYDGIFRGLKRFKYLSLITMGIGIVFVIPIYFLVQKYGIYGAMVSQIVFYSILIIALAIAHKELSFRIDRSVLKNIATYSFICGVAAVGYQIFSRTDIVLLGHYGYLDQIATYDFLNRIFMILSGPFAILAQVIAPNFTHLNMRGEYKSIHSHLKKYTLLTMLAAVTIGTISMFLIPIFVKQFYPAYYNDLLFQILPFSVMIFVFYASALTVDLGIIIPTGHAKIMTIFYSVLAIFNVVLSIILLRLMGYMGPIYATLIASICMLVTVRVIYFMRIKALVRSEVKAPIIS